jgi:pilus assembly protein CpaE
VANIFVIDDDDQLLRMVGLMLERGGHTPTLINSPTQGLEKVKDNKPDLLVLDVMMPGVSGHDICRQLRANPATADLPILMLTARAQDVDRVTALRSGADDYLSKPVAPQELIEHIGDLLTRKRSEPEKPREGTVISFFGLRGGIGRTTLAVNLAAALRRASQEEVTLVDLSPSGGQATMHLRLSARASWADVPTANLDWETLKMLSVMHPSGLRLLAAPDKPLPPTNPSGEVTAMILKVLKANNTFIVLDLPPILSPAVGAALAASDMTIHLVAPEVVSVQMAVQANRAIANMPIKQKTHITNLVTVEAQLPQAAIERGLGTRLAFQVGYDPNQSRAIAQGVPLALTPAQSPLPVVVRRMADAIWQKVKEG